jgi:RNA polymerase sigma factor (sigma-70 family)
MPPLVLDRDSRDFTGLYCDFYPLVYSVVYSKIGDADDAGDITQDVFIRFYEKMGEVENPRTWLLGVMRKEVVEYYRKMRGAAVNVDDLFEDMNLAFVNGFRDARLIIQEALEDMGNFFGEREKVLFDLIAVSNFTYVEAGQALGMSLRQVKYRYALIVRRLIECLNRRGIRNLEDLI